VFIFGGNLEKGPRMTLRDSRIAGYFYSFLNRSILPLLKRTSISPNQLTLIGFGLAALVPVGFYADPWFGFFFILFSGLTDTLDGLLSRALGNGSVFGAFLDSTLDRASDLFFLAGFWILFWGEPHLLLITSLFYLAFFLTFLISYIKARVEGLGSSCQIGFMGRSARVIFQLVWALLLALFVEIRMELLWSGLTLYLVLTMGTVVQRLTHINRQLKSA
jgi:CDP-diacylglycerol---glycerol-3-phosphate 3-phosphatidyltransferase